VAPEGVDQSPFRTRPASIAGARSKPTELTPKVAKFSRKSQIPSSSAKRSLSTLALTFRENKPVNATASFVGNVTRTYLNASALAIVYDDGTVRAAGMLPSAKSTTLRNAASFGALPALSNVAQLVATETGAACVLLKTGAVQCLGTNTSGELGNGTTTSTTTLAAVPNMTDVVELTAGSGHICALKADQSIWCWGENDRGQTGSGSTASGVTAPAHVTDGISVVAGAFHTCSLSPYGQVFCWGANDRSQLSIGGLLDSVVPQAVQGPMGLLVGITQLALGDAHTCALQASGAIWCWGDPDEGQLGNGTMVGGKSPALVANIADATQIATSADATCALSDGFVSCWGADGQGELGDGLAPENAGHNWSPAEVPDLPESTSITAGGNSFCAMTRALILECWGNGVSGQFGDGKKQVEFVPQPIAL
jgi:alpha-tubulin suppressor-like RCC1 family protein